MCAFEESLHRGSPGCRFAGFMVSSHESQGRGVAAVKAPYTFIFCWNFLRRGHMNPCSLEIT